MARKTLLTSALALTLAAAPAATLAQDSGSASNGSQSGNTRAEDLTCAQLVAMDTATVPGVLYFISGYGAGQRDSSGVAADGDMNDSDGSSAESDAPQESGNAAQQAETESNGGDGQDSNTASEERAGAMGTANLARVTGFFDIPVERLIVACENAHDQRVSDMLKDDAQNDADDISSDNAEAPGGNESVDEGGQSMGGEDRDANTQVEPEVEESTPEQGESDSAGQPSGEELDADTQAEPEVEESTPEKGESDRAN